jgi:hypothetical protein
MDPTFLIASTDLVRQNLAGRAAAVHMQEEKNAQLREEQLLEQRRKVLSAVSQESHGLVRESNDMPARVLVQVHIAASNLNYWGVVPDSFTDLKEKEDAALLWRQLSSLEKKCKENLTPQQIEACKNCLNAMALQNLIGTVAHRLTPYAKLQELKPKVEALRQKNEKISVLRNASRTGIVIIGALTYVYGAVTVGKGGALGLLIPWILATYTTTMIANYLFETLRPKDAKPLDSRYQMLAYESGIDDVEFWKMVTDRFGSVPTEEVLQQAWKEQQRAIEIIFGESSTKSPIENPQEGA